MSTTTNYNLTTWSTSEVSDSFYNFAFNVAGNVNSNMTKIDDQMKINYDLAESISLSPIKSLDATMISASYYTATVAGYTSYDTGNMFVLILDTTSSNTLTLNINSLGTLSVMKYLADGSLSNIETGDILASVPVIIQYDGTRWITIERVKAGQVSATTKTSLSGIIKGDSGVLAPAVAGTDYPDISKMFYADNVYNVISSSNFNTITVSGFYHGSPGTGSGAPGTGTYFLIHINGTDTTSASQTAVDNSTGMTYKRIMVSSSWGSWGVMGAVSVDLAPMDSNGNIELGAVTFLNQTLVESAKAQARSNIDAVSVTELLEKTGYGIYTGLQVTGGVSDMTVDVSAGTAYLSDGTRLTPEAVYSISINSHDATYTRVDIIYLSETGVISYLAGTPAATPVPPSVPSGGLLLARVTVTITTTAINDSDIDFIDVEYVGKNNPTLLWINPNPSNNFSGQTISMDLSRFSHIKILFTSRAVGQINSSWWDITVPIGFNDYIEGATYRFVLRNVDVTTSGITFGGGKSVDTYGSTATTNSDAWLIPQKLYGIK